KARFPARRNADIRVYPGLPPPPDLHLISRSVMRPVFRARMFADAITNRLMARVFAPVLASVLMAWVFAYLRTSDSPAGARSGGVSGRGVNWKNGPTKLGIPPCGFNVIYSPPFLPNEFHQ